jgi:hypothetical protein
VGFTLSSGGQCNRGLDCTIYYLTSCFMLDLRSLSQVSERVGAGHALPQRLAHQALTDFKVELDKWGIDQKKDDVVAAVGKGEALARALQATAFESHLCRCLKKEAGSAQIESLTKYFVKYASVSSDDVVPQLWLQGQALMKGTT